MALIALASAKGSPGVTTTALGLALSWHRPVLLVEADVASGSGILAGYLRGSTAHDRGLVDVALAANLGEPLADALGGALINIPGGRVQLLAGLANATQINSLTGLWEPLGELLRGLEDLGTDVILDLGRLGAAHGPEPLARCADLLLVTLRADLPSIAGTRGWMPVLRNDLDRLGQGAGAIQGIVVGPGRPYSNSEIADALGIPVLAGVAWDPRGAAVLSAGEPPPRRGRASFGRSVAALASAVSAALAERPTVAAPGVRR